ncbi:MAG: peptidase [Sphingomonas phyllosphaerae]|uniref:peptidase n=1 Tax=Sphingomonas phyllosphaerae TaxID=257003 RepID=UPI002FFBCB39
MFAPRVLLIGLLGGLSMATASCTDGYGYSGIGIGAGSGYYNDPYYAGGYGNGYYGWYGDYYYPGTGVYVYDRYRRAYPWNDGQRRYWAQRRYGYGDRDVRENWGDVRRERRDYRNDVRGDRQAYRNGQITRDQFRQQRQDARRAYRNDVRRDFRDLRGQNRAEGIRTPRPDRAFRPRERR